MPEKGPAPNPPGPEHGKDCDEGEGTQLCYGVDLGWYSQPVCSRLLKECQDELDDGRSASITQRGLVISGIQICEIDFPMVNIYNL